MGVVGGAPGAGLGPPTVPQQGVVPVNFIFSLVCFNFCTYNLRKLVREN